jgi:hypothetical protein
LPVVDATTFKATQVGFDERAARTEASRCFRCDAVYGCPSVQVAAGRGPADSRIGGPSAAHAPVAAVTSLTPATPPSRQLNQGGAQ